MIRRVKIHVDQKLQNTDNRISICEMNGDLIQTCKKVELKGQWTLRQYNNPVPCDATIVLYPESEDASYWVVH